MNSQMDELLRRIPPQSAIVRVNGKNLAVHVIEAALMIEKSGIVRTPLLRSGKRLTGKIGNDLPELDQQTVILKMTDEPDYEVKFLGNCFESELMDLTQAESPAQNK